MSWVASLWLLVHGEPGWEQSLFLRHSPKGGSSRAVARVGILSGSGHFRIQGDTLKGC